MKTSFCKLLSILKKKRQKSKEVSTALDLTIDVTSSAVERFLKFSDRLNFIRTNGLFPKSKVAFTLLFTTLILVSCGKKDKSVEDIIADGNLSEIKAKKSELDTQRSEITKKIDSLSKKIKSLSPERERQLVSVEILKDTVFKHYVEVQGEVQTDQNIIIYPEFSGVLTHVYVHVGDNVKKGQLLAKIDDGGLSSQLAQTQTQAALAQTTYERRKKLWDQQIGSEIEYLQAKTNYEASQKSVEQTQKQLDKTQVRAPFSGVIDDVISDQGQVVSPGANQLFRLVNLSKMYVTADVPENYLNNIDKGSEVLVDLGSINKEFKGKVEQVSSFINPNNRSFQIRVSVPNANGKVKPNLIATIKINDYTAKKAIVIPQNILQENSQGQSMAFIVNKKNDTLGITQRVIVETGKSYDDKMEITKGLKPGQILVVEGSRTMSDNQKIKMKLDEH